MKQEVDKDIKMEELQPIVVADGHLPVAVIIRMVLCPAGEVLLELSGRPTRPAVTSPCLEHGEGRGGERVETLTVEGFNLDIVIHNIWRRPFTSLFLSAFFTSPLALLFYHRF